MPGTIGELLHSGQTVVPPAAIAAEVKAPAPGTLFLLRRALPALT